MIMNDVKKDNITREEILRRLRDSSISNEEVLSILKRIHGNQVINTNGLFRIIDNKKQEAYINRYNAEIDRRALYKTISIMEDKIVANIIDYSNVKRTIILDKNTLKVIIITDKKVECYDNDLIVIYDNNGIRIITGIGLQYVSYSNIIRVDRAFKDILILNSNKSYNDVIIKYTKSNDKIYNLIYNREYEISLVGDDESIKIINKNGGKYIVNLSNNTCINDITDKAIDIDSIISKNIIERKEVIKIETGIIGEIRRKA